MRAHALDDAPPTVAVSDRHDFVALGRRVLRLEADALGALHDRLDASFCRACELLLACRGRVIVLGIGKSGHIGSKLAATLASTGTPAFFVHPAEASHGDLGMITADDAVLVLSNSGETEELLTILPLIKRLGVMLLALTGRPASTLAVAADVHVDVSVVAEACPLGLAPTASTTAALAMGDALAVALLEARGFSSEDFARSHPGGRLGRRLLVRVGDLMHQGDAMPTVAPGASVHQTLLELTRKRLGLAVIIESDLRVVGVFTDGDLARALDRERATAIHDMAVTELMTQPGITVPATMLAAEALRVMEIKKINALPVTDNDNRLLGVFNMHDLLRAGVV